MDVSGRRNKDWCLSQLAGGIQSIFPALPGGTGPFRLKRDLFPASITLESAASVGGRFVKDGSSIPQRYFITDHLGSTRVVLNNTGSVLERYDYYPYGEKISVTVASSGNTDYLYTGKESQQSLFGINWYDSAARFQTTDGIFTSIDPLAEKYYHISPYAYCAGNPVNCVDIDGLDWYEDEEGNHHWMASHEKEVKDDSGRIWKNIGTEYLLFDGAKLHYFTQGESEEDGLVYMKRIMMLYNTLVIYDRCVS